MEAIQEELGPIDVVVIAYPAGAPMTGGAVPLFLDLVDRGDHPRVRCSVCEKGAGRELLQLRSRPISSRTASGT
jgi:hypothetical protein